MWKVKFAIFQIKLDIWEIFISFSDVFGREDKNEKLGNCLKLSLLLWIIFLQVDLSLCVNKFLHNFTLKKKKKLYGLFLWMGLNCLKAIEPLRGDSLLFTTRSPGVSGTHLINPGRMKIWVDLGATQWFWNQDPWIGNPAL